MLLALLMSKRWRKKIRQRTERRRRRAWKMAQSVSPDSGFVLRLLDNLKLSILVRVDASGEAVVKWLKTDLTPFLHNLYPVLLEESKHYYGKAKGKPPMIRYVRHSHPHWVGETDLRRFASGSAIPFPFLKADFPLTCETAVVGSTIYCFGGDPDIQGLQHICRERDGRGLLIPYPNYNYNDPHLLSDSDNNLSNRFRSLNLSPHSHPCLGKLQWSVGPRFCVPRFCPKHVVAGGKLFLFGGDFPHQHSPFAEVFDPITRVCTRLSNPPFGRLSVRHFICAPLGDLPNPKILLLSRDSPSGFHYILNFNPEISLSDTRGEWSCFHDEALERCVSQMIGTPVSVAEDTSLYWLLQLRSGAICAYNWETQVLLQGPIVGLHHEEHVFTRVGRSPSPLLHLYKDLFCLVWSDYPPLDCNDTTYTKVHFTILRIYKNIPPGSLIASVVGCYCHVVYQRLTIQDAWCMPSA